MTVRSTQNQPIAGASVLLAQLTGSASTIAPAATQTTAADGTAVFTVSSTTASSVTYEATASFGGVDAAITEQAAVSFVAGPASQLLVTAQDGTPIGPQLRNLPFNVRVHLADAFGNPVSNDGPTTITLTAAVQNPVDIAEQGELQRALAGSGPVQEVLGAGQASVLFQDLVFTGLSSLAGFDVIVAADGSGPGVAAGKQGDSNAFSVRDISLAVLAVPTSLVANGTDESTVTVTLTDASEPPVPQPGQPIRVSTTLGTLLDGTTVVAPTDTLQTDAQGQVVLALRSGTVVGTAVITALCPGACPATAEVEFTPGAPAALVVVAGSGQQAEVDTMVSVAPAVRVEDANQNVVPGVEVDFAVTAGGGSVMPAAVTSDQDGIATVTSWTLGPSAGLNSLEASVGSVSVQIDATGLAVLPGAPSAVSAVASSGANATGQATVSWTPPGNTGGVAIDSYTVTASPGGQTCQAAGNATSCVVTGLTNGVAYTFAVTATNSVGTGPASAASTAVTPVGLPSPPTDIRVEGTLDGLRVLFRASPNNGGSPVIQYIARANPTCVVPAIANEVPGVTEYSCEISNLDPNGSYNVFVSAENALGASDEVAAGAEGGGEPGSYSPISPLPVPVNNPWMLLMLLLLTFGLARVALVRQA